LSLIGQDDTVFMPNIQINGSVNVNSGGTFVNGITMNLYTGGAPRTITIINGIITNVV